MVMGIFLLLSGFGLIFGMIANRVQNTWPMIGGILLGVAYLIIGYVFITTPAVGIFAMAVYLAVLFALGGIVRLIAGYKLRDVSGSWLQYVIGILDLIIAWDAVQRRSYDFRRTGHHHCRHRNAVQLFWPVPGCSPTEALVISGGAPSAPLFYRTADNYPDTSAAKCPNISKVSRKAGSTTPPDERLK
jgi:hypothetical protein